MEEEETWIYKSFVHLIGWEQNNVKETVIQEEEPLTGTRKLKLDFKVIQPIVEIYENCPCKMKARILAALPCWITWPILLSIFRLRPSWIRNLVQYDIKKETIDEDINNSC